MAEQKEKPPMRAALSLGRKRPTEALRHLCRTAKMLPGSGDFNAETATAALLYRDSVRCRKNRLPDGDGRILLGTMIGGGFLTAEERQDLTELARDGLAEHRLARRANALVLLDRGMSCEDVGRVLLIDDDTIWTWHRLFEADGVDGLAGFKYGGRASLLSLEQQATLKVWVCETLPRTTRSVDRADVRGRLREP